MAGHSKWANIRRHKEKQDAKRGKLYTKLIRELTVAAQMGGGDPAANPRLRAALDKALGANMTRDVIDRAVKRGAGGGEGENLEELLYEGYGPGGVAIMVACTTNNRNRTAGEVRHAFSKHGGNLGTDGSVAYLFKKEGVITFAPGTSEDAVMSIALDAGAEDVVVNDDQSMDVITTPEAFFGVKESLVKGGLAPAAAEVLMQAEVNMTLDNKEVEEKVSQLLDVLMDLDDVQSVYANVEIEA
ncbi:MAG TPA: YebC/PmpR family DNA-binding transcriptional regulator [Gammaproteobacteria bacterium]|jgi:YebC/PmpR family DNA-binding regulatory protein|nr:YebC/PmpR family DNA-binding transcriptional regulator [Gammaproteobacteria bacterium]